MSSKKKTGAGMELSTNMFAVTDPDSQTKNTDVYNIPINKLTHFKNHPFKLYTGQRFDDLVDSINEHGIINPIIVRPIGDDSFEILSGHNRVEAAKIIGIESVPAIIRQKTTDEDALFIVTETNLRQRSFTDLSHSERAFTLFVHYDLIKQQGKRTDLTDDIDNMINARSNEQETSQLIKSRFRADEKAGENYNLSKNSVARYLRVNKLISSHKERLDKDEIAIRTAVSLSYLTEEEQQIVDEILTKSNLRLDMKKADILRQLSSDGKITEESVRTVFDSKFKKDKELNAKNFVLKKKILSKYFKPEQKHNEIEAVIIEALNFFYAHKNDEKS